MQLMRVTGGCFHNLDVFELRAVQEERATVQKPCGCHAVDAPDRGNAGSGDARGGVCDKRD